MKKEKLPFKKKMISLLSSVTFYRLKGVYGFAANVPTLSGASLSTFKRQKSNNIVFYADPYENIEFADPVVEKYSKTVNFARALPNESIGNECDIFPCIRCYNSGVTVGEPAPLRYTDLLQWMIDVTHPPVVELNNSEDLRLLFNRCGSFVFGIDYTERPKGMKDTETFYVVPGNIIRYFDINLKSGIYVYRGADRMIVRADNNFRRYMHSKIADYRTTNLTDKEFVAGFFLESYNQEGNEKEMKILERLAGKFSEVNFVPVADDMLPLFNSVGNAEYFQFPIFGMFTSDEEKDGRWFVQGENAHNETFLTEMIQGAIDGSLKYCNVSEKINATDKHQMTYNTYESILEDNKDNKDTIIAYTSYYMDAGLWYDKLMSVSEELINNSNVRFYVYNLSVNDIPADFEKLGDPQVIMFRKNETEGIVYDGDQNIKDFIDWVCEYSTNNLKVPKYSPMHYMNDILPPVIVGGYSINYAEEVWGIPGEEENETEEVTSDEL